LLTLFAMSLAYLHATTFDYRFGFVALGVCTMGLAAGTGASGNHQIKSFLQKTELAFPLAGLFAVITTCAFFVIPFGSAGAYLFITFLAVLPYIFCATGLSIQNHEQPQRSFVWAIIIGSLAGIFVLLHFKEQSRGPLFVAWLASGGLTLLAMTFRIRALKLAIAVISLASLGLVGMVNSWNFSVARHWTVKEGKPLYAEDAYRRSSARLTTAWDAFVRMDAVLDKKNDKEHALVFKNGNLFGFLPVDHSQEKTQEQRTKDFPLIALPLLTAHPENILVINSGAGLVTKLASDFGISDIHDMESDRALGSIVQQRDDLFDFLKRPGIKLNYGDVRNALHNDSKVYDQIYLTIPQNNALAWTEPGIAENYLYTREAFENYWAHLKPGGMLVVLAGEEMLYMRALLTAWDVLKADPAGGSDSLVRQAWGFRILALTAPAGPYNYQFMVAKGPVSSDIAARVRKLANDMTLEGLFGPDVTPASNTFNIFQHPYYILYHPQGLDIARKALGEYMVRKLEKPVSLNIPSDQHPNFFEVADDMQPFLKWLVAVCSAALIYIFFIPLADERRLSNPAGAARPPLPVHLGYSLFLGVGALMAMTAISYQTTLLAHDSGVALAATLTGLLLGIGAAIFYRRHGDSVHNRWYWAALAAIAWSALLYWMLANLREIGAGWPAYVRLAVIMAMAFPVGLLATLLLTLDLQYLRKRLNSLIPWTLATYGIAAPVGIILTFWLCQYWGWDVVWASVTGCYVIMLATGFFRVGRAAAQK
jgi:spermidine synthase